ncbi:MAG: phosphomannomutase/phosphoglucomutase [Candidatus Moranbacteria bacterium]|nr:phosphomannomutase/phosphoglucomutase [Candidatus Moranbacteria bacterium]
MQIDSKIFKAYDIRGIYPDEINEQDAYKIAKAFCEYLKPKNVVIGSDVRLSSPSLKQATVKAVTDARIKVIDVGIISTDMLYFAVANYGYAGGFSITASHNPKEYNGIKFVREGSRPISSDTGLFDIRDIAFRNNSPLTTDNLRLNEENLKLIEKKDILDDYIKKIKTFADFSKFRKFKIVANPNFGAAGKTLDKLLEGTGIEIVKLNYEPDGNFPKGRPDPLIPENRKEISKLIIDSGADFGVAWDADADRCFFFTEKGEFIEGYFITAFLAKIFLERYPGSKIIHDTRLTWAIEDTVKENGGIDIATKAGHAFIKERMRKENAVFGGEMSAHYYFRDYWFCDNGMIPLVMMLEFLSGQEKTLSQIMREMFWNKYYVSGEINSEVPDVKTILEKAENAYFNGAIKVDRADGISIDFPDWRFNLRGSNTEPVIRLNVEAETKEKMEEKRDELLKTIQS